MSGLFRALDRLNAISFEIREPNLWSREEASITLRGIHEELMKLGDSPEPSTGIALALTDAAKNCAANSLARVTLTLSSGIQIKGSLEGGLLPTLAHLKNDEGGWATVEPGEIVAVETWLKEHRGGRF
jgi:hypothetical protein